MLAKIVVLIILGLHPAEGTVIQQSGGSYTSKEDCLAAYDQFIAEVKATSMPVDNFRGMCLVTPWAAPAPTES